MYYKLYELGWFVIHRKDIELNEMFGETDPWASELEI